MNWMLPVARWSLFVVSIALYVFSLTLPGLLFEAHEPLHGLYLLQWGWFGILLVEGAWLANPVYYYAVFSFVMRERKRAIFTSVIALVVGLTSFAVDEWWFHEGYGTPIESLGSGFYVWILSFICLLIGCAVPFTASANTSSKTLPG